MCSLSESGAAGGTAETLPVEVQALGTDSLHHVNTLLTLMTLVARRWERPSHGATLRTDRFRSHCDHTSKRSQTASLSHTF